MKRLILKSVFALTAWSLPCIMMAQTTNTVLDLSLDQAIEIGLSEHPTIKVAELEIERVDYSRKKAWGALLPTIAASAEYSRTLKKQVMFFDMPGAAPSDEGIEMGRDNTWNGGFSLQLPIIAPTMWKNINLTKADVENKIEAARASKLTLANEIEKAYYNLLLAQDSYKVIQMSYNNAKLNANNFRNQFEQGLASEYDVLRSDVQVRNLEPSLLQAENGTKLAELQLKVLVGLDASITIKPATKLDDYATLMYEDVLSIDTSLNNNTNLRQLDLQTNYMEKALEVQKMAWYPTLSFTTMYTWMSMNNDFKFSDYRWTPYSTAGLSLSIPIFQGGSRYYNIKQSKVGIQQMGYQREDLVNNLSMQVQASMDNIQKSIKQIASSQEGVKQAEKAQQIMQKSFEIGSATFIELNDADLALTNSRLAYNQAIFDYLTAKTQLELILGNKQVETEKRTSTK